MKGGFEAWKKAGKEVDKVASMDATDFKTLLKKNRAPVFDVRSKGEFFSEHVLQANNSPLAALNQHLEDFPEKETFYLHCAGGYRSMIAASFLKRRGIHNFIEVCRRNESHQRRLVYRFQITNVLQNQRLKN